MRVPVADFLRAVESFEGVPVAHRGTTRAGCDCVGVVIGAMQECGVKLEHGVEYGKWPDADKLTAALERFADKSDDRVPGTLLQVFAGRAPRHVLVYLGDNRHGQPLAMQAWGKRSKVQKLLLTERVAQVWRLHAVDYGGEK